MDSRLLILSWFVRGMVKLYEKVYKKLARRLDMPPKGFPETESGVESKLLAKVYTPEEAALASEMRSIAESPEQIAQKTVGIQRKLRHFWTRWRGRG